MQTRGWEKVPEELKARRAWVCWKQEKRDGKATKVPYEPTTGKRARTNDPATWIDFATACEHVGQYDGLGIMLSDGLCGVDLDHCRNAETDDIEVWAWDAVAELDSYTEISPSGTGLHVLLFAEELPPGRRRKGAVELYGPHSPRYFTVTGQHVDGTPSTVEHRQEALNSFHGRVFGESAAPEAVEPSRKPVALDDEKLLAKARDARNGEDFTRLWAGDTSGYPSQSEADLALCAYLAFWTGGDLARMDRLFRQSGLMREDKWGRADYRERTLRKAVENTREGYTPPAQADAGKGAREERIAAALAEHSDSANGELIAARYGDRLRFDHPRERWLIWRKHWWEEDTTGEVLRLAMGAARFRYRRAWDLPEDQQKAAARWALTSRQHHRLVAAMEIAKVLDPIADAADWDTDPTLIGVANGVVDLRSGRLVPADQNQRITRHLDLPFDPAAACPRWERFVLEVCDGREELAEYLRLAAGYSLTGEMREQCLFVLHGRGSTGKSTLLAHLASVIGPYAQVASFEAFTDPPGHLESLAVLAGARLVTCAETREGTRLNEQRLKALSHGNDRMSAAFKYGHEFSFTPCAKLWLALNHKPRVQDDSSGFWRSVRLLPFNRVFDPEDDPNLGATLLAERAGTLAWLVRAARDWYATGLPRVPEVLDATQAWEREANPLGDWLEARCREDESYQATALALWESYLDWCDEERIPERERLSRRAFGARLTTRWGKAVSARQEGRVVRVYRGVALMQV